MPIKNVKRKPAKRSTQVLKRPTTDRFFPGTAAPTGRILTCSLLNLFFDPDFLEGLPRGTGFGYFQPQTEETNVCQFDQFDQLNRPNNLLIILMSAIVCFDPADHV
jgi:hypothetical protein